MQTNDSKLVKFLKKSFLKTGRKPTGWLYYNHIPEDSEYEPEIYVKPFFGNKKDAEQINEMLNKRGKR